jgi:hypothetical protein
VDPKNPGGTAVLSARRRSAQTAGPTPLHPRQYPRRGRAKPHANEDRLRVRFHAYPCSEGGDATDDWAPGHPPACSVAKSMGGDTGYPPSADTKLLEQQREFSLIWGMPPPTAVLHSRPRDAQARALTSFATWQRSRPRALELPKSSQCHDRAHAGLGRSGSHFSCARRNAAKS